MKIKEIRQVVDYSETSFLPKVLTEVEDMQKKGLNVEIVYSASSSMFSAMLLGREEKKSASPKALQ